MQKGQKRVLQETAQINNSSDGEELERQIPNHRRAIHIVEFQRDCREMLAPTRRVVAAPVREIERKLRQRSHVANGEMRKVRIFKRCQITTY